MRILTIGECKHISNGQRESFKEVVGFEENLIQKIIQMGTVLFSVEECKKKKKKFLKEKQCVRVWGCVHACLCVYCHGESRNTEVKFRIGKSIDA